MDKINLKDFEEQVECVKSNERYNLHDFQQDHLTVSMTVMNPNQETRGHSHENNDEVYIFLEGEGEIQINDKKFTVKANDVVPIPLGAFHKVFNPNSEKLKFLCVFEKYERK